MQRLYSILFLLCSLTGCNKSHKLGMGRAKEQSGSFLGQFVDGVSKLLGRAVGPNSQKYQPVDDTQASERTYFKCLVCDTYYEGPNYEVDHCIFVHYCTNKNCEHCLIKYRCGCARSKEKRYCNKCCDCSKPNAR